MIIEREFAQAVRQGPVLVNHEETGPMLCWAGEVHHLSWRERTRLFFNRTTERTLAEEAFPHLAHLHKMIKDREDLQ